MDETVGTLLRRTTPDGVLTFVVERRLEPDGSPNVAFGFEGSFWHAHPDESPGVAPGDAAFALGIADQLFADRMLICIDWIVDSDNVRILGEFDEECSYFLEADSRLRFWSGRIVPIEQFLDGKIHYEPLRSVFSKAAQG